MDYLLSNEVAPLKRSVMRDLLKLAVAPDIISLAGGLPPNELLPQHEIRRCLENALDWNGARALQYSPMLPELCQWIVEYMRQRGVACELDNIFLTNGNQQGLSILSRLFLDPGAPAVTEAITFTGVQQVTAGRGADMRVVPTNLCDGVEVDALEAAFRQKPRPRLAVLIPDFHNPLGVSLSPEKRQRIAELAAKYQVPVIEDDPYSPLRFEGDMLPPIKAFDEAGWVFYLGSFSKTLAPAMRLGWIVAPKELGAKITVIRESFDLESSTLIQRAVSIFVNGGLMRPHLLQLNAENRRRRDALMQALETHFAGLATWTCPQGGLFSWVTLPEHLDTWALFPKAVERKVAYIPGSAFAVQGGYNNTMRLNFSSVKPDAIREGVSRLSEVIKGAL